MPTDRQSIPCQAGPCYTFPMVAPTAFTPLITPEQVAQFHRDGYCVVAGLFSREEIDAIDAFFEDFKQRGHAIYDNGFKFEDVDPTKVQLRAMHPHLQIAGHYSPPFKPLLEMNHEEIARRIRAARPDILFVCFGCPKQEKWMGMHYRSLGVPVSMGVGGTIPFMGMLSEKFPRTQFLVTGVLGPHSNAHGPNEFLDIATGKRVTACVAHVLAAHVQRKS